MIHPEIHGAGAYQCAYACGLGSLGYSLLIRVHIYKGGGASHEHLQYAQSGSVKHLLITHLSFNGPDVLLKPFHQRYIIRYASEQGHGYMRVGVYQSRHNDLTG